MRKIIIGLFTGVLFGWIVWNIFLRNVDENYVLPAGYTGGVFVLFNETKGEGANTRDGVRIYSIPKDGVLRTSSKQQRGGRDVKYYYADGTQLRYLWPSDIIWELCEAEPDFWSDSIFVFAGRTSEKVHWFCVGSPVDKERLATEALAFLNEMNSQTTILEEGDSVGKVVRNPIFTSEE